MFPPKGTPVGNLISAFPDALAPGSLLAGGAARYYVTTTINITPTYGDNLVNNPDMETGDPPTGWTAQNSTLTGVADERTGGAGAQAINIARNGNNAIVARRTITANAGTRIRYGGWGRRVDATDWFISLKTVSPSTLHSSTPFNSSSSWSQAIAHAVLLRSDASFYCEGRALAGTNGLSVRHDDVFAEVISDYFDLYDHIYNYGDFSVKATYAKGEQAGIRFNQQAVDYYSECWLDNDLSLQVNQRKVFLADRTGNTWTTVGSWNITYVAGAKLTVRVNKDGTREVIYNGSSLASGLATSGLTGTQAGPLLTGSASISEYEWDARAA